MANRLINRVIQRRPSLRRLSSPAKAQPAVSITPFRHFSSSTARQSRVGSSSGDKTASTFLTRTVEHWKFIGARKAVIEIILEIKDESKECGRLLNLMRSLKEDLAARVGIPVPESLDLDESFRELLLTMENFEQVSAERCSLWDQVTEKSMDAKTAVDLEEIRLLLVKDLELLAELNDSSQLYIIWAKKIKEDIDWPYYFDF